MAPSGATQTDDSCCHRSVLQFGEIKNELKNIRQTVDVAVKLLSVSYSSLFKELKSDWFLM
jgi:hypothetical protein